MNRKINRNIIIAIIIFELIISIVVNKSYAQIENIKKEFEITQNEENKLLEDIYNAETETLKIKNIDKQISNKNYINKEIIETKTLDESDEQYIRNQFKETKNYNDEEYKGELTINDIKIETMNNGYYEVIDEKVLSFNNYSDNDLNNIEKEITLNNTKYYLIKVNWEADTTEIIDGETIPKTYKGNKIYQGIKKIANPNTYKVTVAYSGIVEKIDTIYNYTVTYENGIKEEKRKTTENNNVATTIIISGVGVAIATIYIIIKLKNKNNGGKNEKENRKI